MPNHPLLQSDEERADNALLRSLTNKLMDSRTVLLFGEITMQRMQLVIGQLLALDEDKEAPIKLIINSPGGHVEAGDSVYDTIRFIRSPVRVIGSGWVASAGNHIFLAAEKENRFSLPNTRYMIHQPMGGVRGQAVDVEIEAREMLRMKNRLNEIIAERTGQPIDRVKKDTERNFWMTAEEAKEYGIVNKIITHRGELD